MSNPTLSSACGLVAALMGLAVTAASAQTKPATSEVLNGQSPWRFHVAWRTQATVADGKYDLGRGYAVASGTRWVLDTFGEPTPPPPADWITPDFDDGGWARRTGPLFDGYGYATGADACLLALRGRFGVSDPALASPLKLSLTYRGGIVVYLNGAEVGRGHLPPGPLEPLTLAEDYPKAIFVGPNGALLPPLEDRAEVPRAGQADLYNKRFRKLDIDLPADRLRKGTNVLALELHRAAVPAELVAGGKRLWNTCGLVSISLSASSDRAVQPNTQAPKGLQIWNCDPLSRAGTDLSWGDPLEPLRPIAMAAPRNGVSSAQVVVSADAKFKGVSASLGDLKSDTGASLPSNCVQIRYATTGQQYPMLLDKPPAEAQVQPIWLTARLPKDAKRGVYRGTLSIAGLDKPASVPVEITVHDWTLPDLKDYGTSVSLLHCPQSVAGQYKVPMWSDEHFKLLEKSLSLLAYAGNTLLSIPAIGEDLFGDQPLIVFRKEGDGYVPDFRFAKRYMEIQNRVASPPRQLSVQMWNYSISRRGKGRDGGSTKMMAETLKVWLLEGDKLKPAEIPIYTKPGTEATWAAVAAGMKQIMKELGWTRTRLLWGTGGDNLPNDEIVEFFKKIDPSIYWRVATHGGSVQKWGQTPEERTQPGGLVLGYANMVRRNITHRELVPECPFDVIKRDGLGTPPSEYMTLPPLGRIAACYSGIGFVPFDYWTFTTPQGTQRNPLAAYTNFGNITPHCPRAFVMPGPEGPIATPQLEAMREGLQVTEAILHLRAALNDPQRAAAIKPELAADAKATIQALMDVMESNRRIHPQGSADVHYLINRIYGLAAKICPPVTTALN